MKTLKQIVKENRSLDYLHKLCWNNGEFNFNYAQAYISQVNQLLGKGELMRVEYVVYVERYKEMLKQKIYK